MKKNNSSKFVVGLLATCASLGLSSCGGDGQDGGDEIIDASKIQLRIHNFAGGYGTTWINNLKNEYEALHADTKYGDKTGVQILITGDKRTYEGPEFATNNYEVYFAEKAKYPYYVANGYIDDITEAVTGANPYETGKTIESKMDDAQKSFYGYQADDGTTHYYGIPHYSGTYGINYNIDLFQSRGYYFKKDHPDVSLKANWDDYFGYPDTDDLAPGPDGIEGTSDDGLPETFDEFYFLCDYIHHDERYAIAWAGSEYNTYTASMLGCMLSSLLGYEQAELQYSFNGTATGLVQIDGSGKIVLDSDGNPKIDGELAINEKNGYELTRAKSRYDVLSFLQKIIQTTDWQHPRNDNNSQTQIGAQTSFVYGSQGTNGREKDTAMLIDGSWWQNEAADAWNYMHNNYPGKQLPTERNFGLMPFPKAQASDTYHATYTDILNSLQFVKKGLSDEKKALAIDFLQFMNTDEQLAKFTETTYTTRCLHYELSEEQKNSLSLYGKALYEYKNASTTSLVYPFSKAGVYVNHQELFEPSAYFRSTVGGNYNYPAEPFKFNRGSLSDVFEGSYSYYKNYWSNI